MKISARVVMRTNPQHTLLLRPLPPLPPHVRLAPVLACRQDAANAKAMSTAAEHWGKSEQAASKLRTMTSFCRSSGDVKSVPDPYYGGPQVRRLGLFKSVFLLLEQKVFLVSTPVAKARQFSLATSILARPPNPKYFRGGELLCYWL